MDVTGLKQQYTHHPFLFQPHQYSSGEDGDSPPSLTNSSESPQSVSEEGPNPNCSSHFTPLGQDPTSYVATNHQSIPSGNQSESVASLVKSEGSSTQRGAFSEDGLSSTQGMSPTWDSVFGTESSHPTTDAMDLSGNLSGLDNETERTAKYGQNMHGGGSWTSGGSSADDTRMNDDAIFASLIQQDNFDVSASRDDGPALKNEASIASEKLTLTHLPSSTNVQSFIPQSNGENGYGEVTPPQSAHPSTSQLSSRRNSAEQEENLVQQATRMGHTGSHFNHASDMDLPSSSHLIVRPPVDEIHGLQVHIHGIPLSGAKSRVETQIRLRLELVRQKEDSLSSDQYERIGAFNHVKLPPMTGTKRRSKKHKPTDIDSKRTLYMDATVVRASYPHHRVQVCESCQHREKKRAQRRKSGARKDEQSTEEDQFTVEDFQALGVDPHASDAQSQARLRSKEEDHNRIVVFNCGDFVSFEEGACVLPTRITCYCRHHKEKTGFCIVFTMRNHFGNVVASGSTPPIMITDDHKSVAAAASLNAKRMEAPRSRAASSEAADEVSGRSVNGDGRRRKSHRSKPYGDAEERSSRRNTSSFTMTPHTSTGQNTPSIAQSPSTASDINQPDFWNAFAAMATVSSSPPKNARSSVGAQTPHEIASPVEAPLPQQHSTPSLQEWVSSISNQGSISSQTLSVGPQSIPGFDMNTFLQSIHQNILQSQREGNEASVQQLTMLARSLPGHNMDGLGTLSHIGLPPNQSALPNISKLIPGEGPTSGGIEVTVLGENFVDGLTCYFGDVPATSTKVWGSNTLLCILPPSASPGPVAVTVKGNGSHEQVSTEHHNRTLQLFTYSDSTDRALMELALQVVGLQMTGQMQTARDVAMRVVGSGPNQSMTKAHGASHSSTSQGSRSGVDNSRNAVNGLFAGANHGSSQSFQDSVLSFLQTIDVDLGNESHQRTDAIRLANKQGHTLLHLSVMLGFHRLTLEVIRRGCPIDARDYNGLSALHFAALHGRVTIARLLLVQGANPNVLCESGKNALDIACEEDQFDVEGLLERAMGIDPDYEDEESNFSSEESDGSVEEEEEVFANEKDLDARTDDNGTFKRFALFSADDDIVANLPSPYAGPLGHQKSSISEKSQVMAEKEIPLNVETRNSSTIKALFHGSLDFANKARFGMPTALHDSLNHLHMPVVSVFQMALPPSIVNWTTSQASVQGQGKGTGEVSADGVNLDEFTKATRPSTWRNIIEESSLWINPLSSPPPPAYESLSGQSPENRHGSSSRFQAIAEPSTSSTTSQSAQRRSALQENSSNRLLTQRLTSSSKSSSSSKLSGKPRRLQEDRMLVYFWLPILVSVLLLLVFAKPSSVLSYEDLRSFIPMA